MDDRSPEIQLSCPHERNRLPLGRRFPPDVCSPSGQLLFYEDERGHLECQVDVVGGGRPLKKFSAAQYFSTRFRSVILIEMPLKLHNCNLIVRREVEGREANESMPPTTSFDNVVA